LINVVMQLPSEVGSTLESHVRLARESDIPTLNRWRRLYKEERGIVFDADMDALVQNQRVYVYDLPTEETTGGSAGTGGVVAVAKFDLELRALVEIGGVYTFPEYRHKGYGVALMRDLAQRIRQMGKVPTLQVDEENLPALGLYEKAGWRAIGRLARIWLTG
jgi:predicted GNAT family acetyltransferase